MSIFQMRNQGPESVVIAGTQLEIFYPVEFSTMCLGLCLQAPATLGKQESKESHHLGLNQASKPAGKMQNCIQL